MDVKTDIKDKGEELYCHHDTYYFAFVYLSMSWITGPIYIMFLVIVDRAKRGQQCTLPVIATLC